MTPRKKGKASKRKARPPKPDPDRPSRLNTLTGLLLLPVCLALLHTLLQLVLALSEARINAPNLTRQLWWLGGGFAFWLALWFTFARPYRSYILAHELTHALWGILSGYRVLKMHIGEDDGYVELSGSNWMVTLAPYFFPLYTFVLVGGWGLISLFKDLTYFQPFILAALGLSWGFHLTFTLVMMYRNQPDVVACGTVFAYPVVIGANVAFLCLFIVVTGSPTLEQAVTHFTEALQNQWVWLLSWFPTDFSSRLLAINEPHPRYEFKPNERRCGR